MQIKIWNNYSKRLNSTAHPSSGGTTLNVELKEDTSVESPAFVLLGNYPNVSYVSAFGHYYFVEDRVILTGNRTLIKCNIDLLASYKSDIGNTTALVARSSSNFNKWLRDDYVSTYSDAVSAIANSYEFPFSETGCFVISVVNVVADNSGYVANYLLTSAQFRSLALWLNGSGSYGGWTWADVQSDLILQFGDCFDCIRAVKWLPIPYSDAKTAASSSGTANWVMIGKYATDTQGYLIDKNAILSGGNTFTVEDVLPKDFRASAPYASVDVYLPYYGLVSLPPHHCVNGIQYSYYIDLVNGDCTVRIYSVGTDNEKLLANVTYNIGVDTPIAQVGRTAVATTQNAVGFVGSMLSGNIGGMINSGLGLISATASNGASSKGSQGGRSMAHYNEIVAYVSVMKTTVPEDLEAIYGRPLMSIVKINTLSGYVQTINASVSCDCTEGELSKINGMLNSGIYYE